MRRLYSMAQTTCSLLRHGHEQVLAIGRRIVESWSGVFVGRVDAVGEGVSGYLVFSLDLGLLYA